LAIGTVLALLAIITAARRWSEPPLTSCTSDGGNWRRDEGRYYHERRLLIVLLAAVVLVSCLRGVLGPWEWMRYDLAGLVMYPSGSLALALFCLALQSAFSGWPKRPGSVPIGQPRLAPEPFLLTSFVLLAIFIFAMPILAAWGFALWFRLA
jgi:hypothetical protein